MINANRQELNLLPKLIIASAVLLIAAGVLWYGITVEVVLRIFRDLFNRPSEPMSFRFILQIRLMLHRLAHPNRKRLPAP